MMAGWTLPDTPRLSCTIAGAAFNPGPALSPPSTAKNSSRIAWLLRVSASASQPGATHVEAGRILRRLRAGHLARTSRAAARRQKAPACRGVFAWFALEARRAARLTAMPSISPARGAAFKILMKIERGKGHSDDLLRAPAVASLSPQDRNLATALVLGVLRWQIQLDQQIQAHLARPTPSRCRGPHRSAHRRFPTAAS